MSPSLHKDGQRRAPSGGPRDAGQRSLAPFRRVLIANRGEIAVRIIRACRELGTESVAVYSDRDVGALHVRLADRAVRLGPPPASESYLCTDAILEAAAATGCDAVHPGYGFLSERAEFAAAVEAAGMAFVGPSPAAIAALGDKLTARRLAHEVDVPVVPRTLEAAPVDSPSRIEETVEAARRIGFPLLVKAAAGGGGRGMRRVETVDALPAALAAASAEAASAFGAGAVYLEREIRPARHVEVQLVGDRAGSVVALGERDCSIQRRHQKLVEEAPAPGLTGEERTLLHDFAVRLGRAAGLTNAATAEFLFDTDRRFWFLEVNTRLQVEHGVTELVTGIDIVHEQLAIAAGRSLSSAVIEATAQAARPSRHSIEVRLTAEDPGRGFVPTPGRVTAWQMPAGPGVRVDSGVEAGDLVPPEYDNLMAKIMVVAGTRDGAIDRLERALSEASVGGLQTTLPLHRAVARDPAFRRGDVSTEWLEERWDGEAARGEIRKRAAVAAAVFARDVDMPGADGLIPSRPSPVGGWLAAGRREGVDGWRR